MDPASVIGIIGVITQITQAIYAYGDAVSDAKNEIARLRSELFGMQAALMQIEQDLTWSSNNNNDEKIEHQITDDAQSSQTLVPSNLQSPQTTQMLQETRAILEELAKTLQEGLSKSKRLLKRLVWPLKRDYVQALATHLERMKTYFILVATNDTLVAIRDVQESLQDLHLFLDESQRTGKESEDFTLARKWLSTCEPEVAHAAALDMRLEGTGAWFLDEEFEAWTRGTNQLLWLRGLPGSGKTCLTAACADKYTSAFICVFVM